MKFRNEIKWIAPLVVVCILVFANSLMGEFVYDDTRQILRNPLIQNNNMIWRALTSDVWAFKGEGSVVASNYWRPLFTGWYIVNFRLFGASPLGWHVASLLLHTSICVLAFSLLRRWGYTAMVAFTIALIFAVHPIHVESVAWVTGVPDLLFALPFLGSLWFFQTYIDKPSTNTLILSVLLYALALGAKEIGILCLPIYYFMLTRERAEPVEQEGQKKPKKAKKKVDINTPLLLLGGTAAAYFFIRWSILGALSRPADDAVSLTEAIMSAPMIFAFYLKQAFFPYAMSINYSITPVSEIGLWNFVLPVAICVLAVGAVLYLARNSARERIAASIFLLPLIPAMNATAFPSEDIVHDRYLYLPLLGLLMLIVPLVARFIRERYVLMTGAALAALLCFQTFVYGKTWANELSVWGQARSVSDSAFAAGQHAAALSDLERHDEAISAYTYAIDKKPSPRAYLGRGRSLIVKRQYPEAERDLKNLLSLPQEQLDNYVMYQAYEALGMVYTEQRNYEAAGMNFIEARSKLPIYAASLTAKLAIVMYQSGLKPQAMRELENAKAQAKREMLPESKSVLFRLAMLYAEQNRKEEAKAEVREYLSLTAGVTDKHMIEERKVAVRFLDSLK